MPFGFHLAMDTLPSRVTASGGSRSTLAVSSFRFRARLGFSIPSSSLRPTRHYPRLRIRPSSSERRRDFNPPEQCAAQRTLWDCPTPWARSSPAYVLGLPDASHHSIGGGRTQGLPVLVRGVSVRARGLRPRGTRTHLAISMRHGGAFRYPYGVGVPDLASFAAQYPARTYPCQRFEVVLAGNRT